ncbi:MAG TPA: hypothetical protein VGF46_12625, partial [Gaiellales bacterium]
TSFVRPRTLKLKIQLAHKGTLAISMPGLHGSHPLTRAMKGGTHTVRMQLPASAPARGTIVVHVKLTQAKLRTASVRRAIMLPAR